MSAALITATLVSLAGLLASIVLGLTSSSPSDLARHVSLSIFVTLITLLTHSMTMFYLIGKGKAIREAAQEGGLSADFFARVSRARKPVFSIGPLAIAMTMVTAIVGGGVDTGVIPAGVHGILAYSAVAANLAALRAELIALTSAARVVSEVNQLLGA
jgi:hypothetical protein